MKNNAIDSKFLLRTGLIIGGGVAAYFLIKKLFKVQGDDGEPLPSPQAIDCNKLWDENNAEADHYLSRDKNAYFVDADAIQAAIVGAGLIVSPTEDDTLIGEILKRAVNNYDVAALICAFGERKPSLLTPAQPLPVWITAYLDNDIRTQVNEDYNRRGITFQW
jgi:hypothetical protein